MSGWDKTTSAKSLSLRMRFGEEMHERVPTPARRAGERIASRNPTPLRRSPDPPCLDEPLRGAWQGRDRACA